MGLMNTTIFVGLDVHKATVSVAVAEGLRGGEVRCLGTFPNRPDQIAKLAQRLAREGRRLSFCYEAGPCGYGLYRQLTGLGHDCIVVAPSLIPVKAGDRVKTDRRDAAMLAKLHRAGELTAVWVPDAAHEAMRDLARARATAVCVLGKARQHLQGFLLRHGRLYAGKKGWTQAYRRWNIEQSDGLEIHLNLEDSTMKSPTAAALAVLLSTSAFAGAPGTDSTAPWPSANPSHEAMPNTTSAPSGPQAVGQTSGSASGDNVAPTQGPDAAGAPGLR